MKIDVRYRLPRVDVGLIRRIVLRFGSDLRPHAPRLALSAAALVGVSLVTLAQPWPIKLVFDHVLLARPGAPGPLAAFSPEKLLATSVVAILALAAVKGLLAWVQTVQARIVGHRFVADVRLRVFSHVQRLPQSVHDYRETGELLTRLTGDIDLLKDLLVSVVIEMSSHLLLLLGMLVILFRMDVELALVALGVMPVFTLAAFRFSGRIRSSARKQREAYGKIVAAVQESLAGIAQIKGFAQEKQREKLVGRSLSRDVRANVRTTRITANYERTVELIAAASTGLVVWIGAHRVMAGSLTPGDLLIVLAYLRGMYRPLRRIARLTAKMSKASARAEKIMETLDMPAEVRDAPDAVSASGIRGDIEFNRVRFGYRPDQPVLENVSFHVPAGRVTLILGRTGVGKSTIARLITRLYAPDEGTIRVDGRDIAEYRVSSLRKRITTMSQDTFLFRMTIAENIAFGVRHASRDQVEEAARYVGADEFIRMLPDGYDTLVGEGGVTLSGGQRQRISLARAYLRATPVMIFDEPATGLDVHAEQTAKDVLSRMHAGRTLIVITHRLHFLDLADHVVFLESGSRVHEGDPQSLWQTCDAYRRFVGETNVHAAGGET